MQIAVDYTPAVRQVAGIGRYTRSLVRALVRTATSDSFVLLHASPSPQVERGLGGEVTVQAPNVSVRRLPVPDRVLTVVWHRWRLPLWADLLVPGTQVFYSPNFVLPPLRQAVGVVTVHDLSFLRYPETHDPHLVAFLRAAVPRAVQSAALVLADSAHARRETIELLGVPEERTAVVLSAPDPVFRPVADPAALGCLRQCRHLDRPYFLSVGTLQPRKNLVRLARAVRLVRDRTHQDVLLVHAGRRGWRYDDVLSAIRDDRLADSFQLIEDADDAELRLLYAGAVALAFPSLYEGFGIPCLEAMACGCPVVTSNSSSLPEVVGDAALMVEPTDVAALAEALTRCLDDAVLREKLIARGYVRAAQFTWERSAAQLSRLLHQIA